MLGTGRLELFKKAEDFLAFGQVLLTDPSTLKTRGIGAVRTESDLANRDVIAFHERLNSRIVATSVEVTKSLTA